MYLPLRHTCYVTWFLAEKVAQASSLHKKRQANKSNKQAGSLRYLPLVPASGQDSAMVARNTLLLRNFMTFFLIWAKPLDFGCVLPTFALLCPVPARYVGAKRYDSICKIEPVVGGFYTM